jgi:hypothetical protein
MSPSIMKTIVKGTIGTTKLVTEDRDKTSTDSHFSKNNDHEDNEQCKQSRSRQTTKGPLSSRINDCRIPKQFTQVGDLR